MREMQFAAMVLTLMMAMILMTMLPAEAMGLTESQLSEWIRKAGYKTFRQWINALRIDEASRQLKAHGDFNIGAIADLCGIDRSHFHRLFREHTGMTPAQYQQQESSGPEINTSDPSRGG